MKINDLPDELSKCLMEQEEPYTIFFHPRRGLTLVSGIDTPAKLWDYYKRGDIQAWLEDEGKDKPKLEDYRQSMIIKMANPVYNVTEIAKFLGVTKRDIYLFVKHASMPHFREGRQLRFRLFAVLSWRGDISRELERRGLAPKQPWKTA